MNHPSYPNLSFDVAILPAQKSSGEFMFSLGDPPLSARRVIENVFYKGVDITEFVTNHCEDLFEKWEEDLND
jgi:hypothetical protein